MKLKQEFVKRTIDNDVILIPVLNNCSDYKGIISLNETAERIYDLITEEKDENEIVNIIVEEYDVSRDKVISDLNGLCSQLKKLGLL